MVPVILNDRYASTRFGDRLTASPTMVRSGFELEQLAARADCLWLEQGQEFLGDAPEGTLKCRFR